MGLVESEVENKDVKDPVTTEKRTDAQEKE